MPAAGQEAKMALNLAAQVVVLLDIVVMATNIEPLPLACLPRCAVLGI